MSDMIIEKEILFEKSE